MNASSCAKQLLLSCPVLILAFGLASCSQEKAQSITISTGGHGGSYQTTGHRITRIVNQHQQTHGFQLRDDTSAGSVANINAIMSGEREFGIAQADHQYDAYKGLSEWQAKGPQTELRAVFSLYTESVTLVAGGDSGINSMLDLRGRRVDIGSLGSGTRRNAIDALQAAGISWEQDIEAREESLDERLAKLMHGELDAFFYTVGHPSTDIKFATYSVRGARFISLLNIPDILAENPFYSRSVIPTYLYPRAANESAVNTIGVRATFLTSASVSDEIVYAVTKAVFDDLDALGEYDPVLKTLSKENMLDGLTAPIHPGALRYYREAGLVATD